LSFTNFSPPRRKSREIWLRTFSVAASAAATDEVYRLERSVSLALEAAHAMAPARIIKATPVISIVKRRALPARAEEREVKDFILVKL
jgi:hypothetical protein